MHGSGLMIPFLFQNKVFADLFIEIDATNEYDIDFQSLFERLFEIVCSYPLSSINFQLNLREKIKESKKGY